MSSGSYVVWLKKPKCMHVIFPSKAQSEMSMSHTLSFYYDFFQSYVFLLYNDSEHQLSKYNFPQNRFKSSITFTMPPFKCIRHLTLLCSSSILARLHVELTLNFLDLDLVGQIIKHLISFCLFLLEFKT